MGEIIDFHKRKEPLSENVQEVSLQLKTFAYKKLLPRGLSQTLVDNFLTDFEPILISLIPPSITLMEGIDGDPHSDTHEKIAENAKQQINDYVLKVIGMTFQREMMHFVKDQLRQAKE